MKTGVCNSQWKVAFEAIVHRFGTADEQTENMAVVYVDPRAWTEMNIDAKTVFAGWAGLCEREKDMLSIRDALTGNSLMTWSLDGGLR